MITTQDVGVNFPTMPELSPSILDIGGTTQPRGKSSQIRGVCAGEARANTSNLEISPLRQCSYISGVSARIYGVYGCWKYNPGMLEEKLLPPQWISTPAALRRMMQDLMRCPQVAVDTESNGLHAYQEQVCLLQFSTGTIDYLVDPLALEDLSPLGPIFANPSIEIDFPRRGVRYLLPETRFWFPLCPPV